VTAVAQKNTRTALWMALLVAFMVGLAFASVPLYRMFCELTGFDGTPRRAEKAPGAVAGQIGVRFDANVHPGLPWRFEPEQETVGKYFNKIQCFCFTEQTLKPGQTVDMPVVFFVDPKILKDDDTKDVHEITLSYTFYPVESGATGR
jgi:cytochrome c oxidase assembly protein subunit 11